MLNRVYLECYLSFSSMHYLVYFGRWVQRKIPYIVVGILLAHPKSSYFYLDVARATTRSAIWSLHGREAYITHNMNAYLVNAEMLTFDCRSCLEGLPFSKNSYANPKPIRTFCTSCTGNICSPFWWEHMFPSLDIGH
jgi:hypothetical protein